MMSFLVDIALIRQPPNDLFLIGVYNQPSEGALSRRRISNMLRPGPKRGKASVQLPQTSPTPHRYHGYHFMASHQLFVTI